MVYFYFYFYFYLRLSYGTESVFCFRLLEMTRIEMDLKIENIRPFFVKFRADFKTTKKYHG